MPLVDAQLLRRLAPVMVGSARIDGKALLGHSPRRPVPESLIRRAKTGFGIPVAQWIEKSARQNAGRRLPVLAGDHMPWARRWACQVARSATR